MKLCENCIYRCLFIKNKMLGRFANDTIVPEYCIAKAEKVIRSNYKTGGTVRFYEDARNFYANKNYDCPDYKRIWWKVWVAK